MMSKQIGLTLAAAGLLAGLAGAAQAQTPKQGGILRIQHRDTPASASIHEEATVSTVMPFMGIFNNLVLFKQDVPQNSPQSIEPELATSWSWSADNLNLTFKLREGVKWHDGQPFTAKDVVCTMDLVRGKAQDSLRKNPRKSWYDDVAEVKANGDYEVTIRMNRPQPSILSMLASGYSPMYPCHVKAAQQRTKPIGTGPFRFVEFKQNESMKLTRNPDYWKKGKPYLDGIEYQIISNRSTAVLAFVAGKVDMTFPTEVTYALMRDVKAQAPKAVCHFGPTNVSTNLIINRDKPPFDNADIRKAMALTMDRKAFIDILSEGHADMGGALLPAPAGIWGMPAEMRDSMLGYGDVTKNRAQARAIMEKLGYGPNNRLKVKVSTRNIAQYRDPAVILIDHLKEIYVDGELEPVETAQWHAKVGRGDYSVGLNLTGNSIDDPDQSFYENFACKSERNYSKYCNPEVEALFDKQSSETDVEKRRKLVWEIDQKLQNDVARPIILHGQAGTCWAPELKGYTPMINSIYNGYRFDELWLDR